MKSNTMYRKVSVAIASRIARSLRGCLLCLLAIGLAACSGSGSDATPMGASVDATVKAAGTTIGSTTFRVVNLSATGAVSSRHSVNAAGQVAFSASSLGYFYNGTAAQSVGTLGGSNSYALALNGSGQVVGQAGNAGGGEDAFTWTASGGMVDLGGPANAVDVNDSGQVVGQTYTAGRGYHPFSWTASGGMVDLGGASGAWSTALAVSGSGQVVGVLTVNSGFHAFSWTPSGGIVDLGTLTGGSTSYAAAVNGTGQVVGWSDTANGNIHPFSWTSGGGMVDLGTLGGGVAQAVDVNAIGQVVGCAFNVSNNDHAFLWTSANGMVDLGTLGGMWSCASAINGSGWIVGESDTGTGTVHAFAWTPTDGIVDLNTRIPTAPSGLELNAALAVSDNGAIVAYSNAGLVLLVPGTLSTAAPSVGPISADDPVAIGQTVDVSVNFTDANAGDTFTATWNWGDGSASQSGTVSQANGSGTVTGTHTYNAAGVYPVTVTVTDSAGPSAQVQRGVVVYDPSAGFVTGGGWIMSPPGAYKQDPTLAGRATFGFVSKYQKGATTPTGTTDFQFRTANLNFHSENYQWLVVSGASAQYKGTGTINGAGSYQFILTAVDGDLLSPGTPDRFRIKIWHFDTATNADVVDYDNQLDSGTIGTTSEGTAIGGGDIVIHP